MSEKRQTVFDLLTGEISSGSEKQSAENQIITINDGASESAKILVKEYGSDREYKAQGKVDVRRFSNIRAIDVIWLMYFQNIPKFLGGDYADKICESFLNDRYSVDAQHKKIGVAFQDSLSGRNRDNESTDKRNWVQRHITQRGKPRYE